MEDAPPPKTATLATAIVPTLSVRDGKNAIKRYERAFGATELWRVESDEGKIVAGLSVDGARLFLADESPDHGNFSPESLEGSSVRIELIVQDPDAVFKQALAAGAKEVWPVAG